MWSYLNLKTLRGSNYYFYSADMKTEMEKSKQFAKGHLVTEG